MIEFTMTNRNLIIIIAIWIAMGLFSIFSAALKARLRGSSPSMVYDLEDPDNLFFCFFIFVFAPLCFLWSVLSWIFRIIKKFMIVTIEMIVASRRKDE